MKWSSCKYNNNNINIISFSIRSLQMWNQLHSTLVCRAFVTIQITRYTVGKTCEKLIKIVKKLSHTTDNTL
jgi:predicted MarR family transcription regulator